MEPAPVADAVLVERLQAGDESALSGLMQRHQAPLYYFVRRYLCDETLACEIVQETFVRAYFKIKRFKPTASFKTWLYTIAVNLCRDQARRTARRPAFHSLDDPGNQSGNMAKVGSLSSGITPAVESEGNERRILVESAIAALPLDLRECLMLFSLEGLPQKECAQILGLTPKAVELRVYRAKKLLKAKLKSVLSEP
jgi:RNA polymerase sigma-70 factor (ECF subfamily)